MSKDKELEQHQIYCVSKETIYCYSKKHPIQKKINSNIRVLLYHSLFGSFPFFDIAFKLACLFNKASLLAGFCNAQNVKAFIACENYYSDVDAMNLIGSHMGIKTLGYQYSNMSEIVSIMMTTADTVFTFSSLYHQRWSNNKVQPKSFVNIGYLYDSSFNLVEERAAELRKRLMNKGSQFIICYFDENVMDNKYGYMCVEDHYRDISTLAKVVIQDSTTAVIIKTQYMSNSPFVMFKGDQLIESAKATGRFTELFHGQFRNLVFPAEPAMAADIVISHAIGGTASLEAALNDRRCIKLNPYGIQSANIEILKQFDILYDDIDSALSAVHFFRQGKPEYQDLGDWSSIINLFDPFRDGQSARRLREALQATFVI